MNCNKTTNLCSDLTLATCVDYEGTLGTNTTITENCVSQNDVNEDLYIQADDLYDNISTEEFVQTALDYELIDGELLLKSIIKKLEEEIITLKERVTELESEGDLTVLGLDFECLVDVCGDPITTKKQLFQALITQACL